jgi:hypothetical protein
MCIECSEGEFFDTLDLCLACQAESVYREEDNKDHKPSHPMIQLRRAIFMIEVNPLLLDAKSRLSDLSEEYAMHCLVCNNELSKRPYWCCIECRGTSELHPTFDRIPC